MTEPIEFFNLEESTRLLKELVTHAGPDGISDDELTKAWDAMTGLVIQAAIWRAWETGQTKVGWNTELQDLIWKAADA